MAGIANVGPGFATEIRARLAAREWRARRSTQPMRAMFACARHAECKRHSTMDHYGTVLSKVLFPVFEAARGPTVQLRLLRRKRNVVVVERAACHDREQP